MQMYTKHYQKDRKKRNQLIQEIGGDGKVIFSKLIFDEKRNKGFYYEITSNSVLIVRDVINTHVVVTKMIARPKRILQYWADAPEWLLEKSADYTRKKYYI